MPEPHSSSTPTASLLQFLWHIFIAVLVWLLLNLIILAIVSFIAFSLLSSLGKAKPDEAFTLALVCAIPAALTVSSLVAGRKLIPMLWRYNRD